jgi:hypothetical protein
MPNPIIALIAAPETVSAAALRNSSARLAVPDGADDRAVAVEDEEVPVTYRSDIRA